MEHSEAVKLNSVERYVLGDLTASERDAFEEHFFECRACAAEVRAAAAFIDNAREIMRRNPPEQAAVRPRQERPLGWFEWLRPGYALTVIAGLVLLIGYLSLVAIPGIKRDLHPTVAQALPTLSLTASGSRGEAGIPEIALRANSSFGIYLDVPADGRFASYSCALRNRTGSDKLNVEITAAQAKETVELFIPGGTLAPGSYEVVIFGYRAAHEASEGEEIARYPFAVKNPQ